MRVLLPVLALMLLPAAAAAKPVACLTSLEGFPTALQYDDADTALRANRTTREWLFGGAGDVTCPGYVTLRALTPGLSDSERAVFCLSFDRKAKTYTGFAEGARDAYVHCAAPTSAFCQRANDSAEAALAIAKYGATAATGVATGAVAESAGAVILTGSTASLSATLSGLGTSAMSVLSAPGLVTAAAVTLVAVGGAVYVCSE